MNDADSGFMFMNNADSEFMFMNNADSEFMNNAESGLCRMAMGTSYCCGCHGSVVVAMVMLTAYFDIGLRKV